MLPIYIMVEKLWLLFTADQLDLVDKTWHIGYKLLDLPVSYHQSYCTMQNIDNNMHG